MARPAFLSRRTARKVRRAWHAVGSAVVRGPDRSCVPFLWDVGTGPWRLGWAIAASLVLGLRRARCVSLGVVDEWCRMQWLPKDMSLNDIRVTLSVDRVHRQGDSQGQSYAEMREESQRQHVVK